MCGLITVRRTDDKTPVQQVLRIYEAQKIRGEEGFGYVAIKDKKLVAYERAETEAEIIKKLIHTDCDEIIFHHRFPTSTPNFEHCAHPIKVSNNYLKYDYYLIHNGCIWGDGEFKKTHEAMGFKYTTQCTNNWMAGKKKIYQTQKWNDSEALAIELALDLDNNGNGIQLVGSIAFVMLRVDKKTQKVITMFYGRNEGSPLVLDYLDKVFVALKSQGGGARVPTSTLYAYDYETGITTDRPYQIGKNDIKVETEPAVVVDNETQTYMLSLSQEYDDLEAQLGKAGLSAEAEDAIRYRMQDINDELAELAEEKMPIYNLS